MLRQERLVAFFGHRSTWRCEHFMDVTPSFGTCFPRGVSDMRQFEDPENLRSDRGWGTIFRIGAHPKTRRCEQTWGLEKRLRGLSARCGDCNCLACTELRHPGGFRLYKRC